MTRYVWLNEKNDCITDEDFHRIQELVESVTVTESYPGNDFIQFFRIYS